MENDNRYSFERLTLLLQQKGVRPSAQRIAVLSAVANSSLHPSAEEIYVSISSLFQSLSRTTVYNSLKVLVKCGLVRELEIESGCLRYDLALKKPHGHFVCRKCSKIFDMPLPDGLADFSDDTFDIDSVEITLRGICPHCRNK